MERRRAADGRRQDAFQTYLQEGAVASRVVLENVRDLSTFICFAASARSTFGGCCRASGRGTCVVSGHVIHLYSLSAELLFFARHNENRNEKETLSGVPNTLRPLREPGVIEGPAAFAAVEWPPTGRAPAQDVMYNARQNGSHFIDEGAQGGGGVKRRRAPEHCSDCGRVKQKGPFSRYHVPSLPRAQQSSSNIGSGGAGGEGGCRRGQMFLRRGPSAQNIQVAQQGQRNIWQRVLNVIRGSARVYAWGCDTCVVSKALWSIAMSCFRTHYPFLYSLSLVPLPRWSWP